MLLLLVLFSLTFAQTPNCTWQCDDPVCPAICQPVCSPPACTFIGCSVGSARPTCWTTCDTPYNAIDTCPLCSTHCNPPPLSCTIECEEVQCGWVCDKPIYCHQPQCQLQCEQPTCQYSLGSLLSATFSTVLLLFLLLLNSD
jgi:hypothetical protein